MFESPVKQNQSPESARRPAAIYSVVLTRGRDLSRSANAVSAGNRKFSLPPSHLAPSFGVTPSNLWISFTANSEDLVILACTVFD